MYLLVVVTLVIGLLSIYAQVLSLQAARYAASLTGMANTMVIWHGAAVSMGADILKHPPGGLSLPCNLTNVSAYGLTPCAAPTNSPSSSGTVTDSSNNLNYISATEKVHLPLDYKAATYQFYSVLYRDTANNQPYVVTFACAPGVGTCTPGALYNPAPGYLSLASSPSSLTSLTPGDLLHQFTVLGIPDYSFGTAKGTTTSVLMTQNYASIGTIRYNLPMNGASAVLPAGAIAVVSSPSGF